MYLKSKLLQLRIEIEVQLSLERKRQKTSWQKSAGFPLISVLSSWEKYFPTISFQLQVSTKEPNWSFNKRNKCFCFDLVLIKKDDKVWVWSFERMNDSKRSSWVTRSCNDVTLTLHCHMIRDQAGVVVLKTFDFSYPDSCYLRHKQKSKSPATILECKLWLLRKANESKRRSFTWSFDLAVGWIIYTNQMFNNQSFSNLRFPVWLFFHWFFFFIVLPIHWLDKLTFNLFNFIKMFQTCLKQCCLVFFSLFGLEKRIMIIQ